MKQGMALGLLCTFIVVVTIAVIVWDIILDTTIPRRDE